MTLYARADKCEFHRQWVEYLGFIVSPDGLSMDPAKTRAVQEWPTPANVKDIQSFLGFANFYRRFIPKYSGLSAPLTRLLRKNMDFAWTDKAQKAFEALKTAFTTAPILVHFNPDYRSVVETDASCNVITSLTSLRSAGHGTGGRFNEK
jgi:hypothetical protein